MEQQSINDSSQTILFVDDDPFVLHAYQRMTRQLRNCCCMFMTDQQFVNHPEVLQQVSLVLTDQYMPAISGAQVLRQCRRLQPTARRVLLSGDLNLIPSQQEDAELQLAKPLKRETLLQLLALQHASVCNACG